MAKLSSAKYDAYKNSHQKEKNRIKRIEKHLKNHVNDLQSAQRIPELQKILIK